MKDTRKYNLVNWADGMLVMKDHQIQTENFFINNICDSLAVQLTNYNYGLLPSININIPSSEFEISEQATNRLEIRLRKCNAITLGGYRIAYNPEQSKFLMADYTFAKEEEKKDVQSERWDIILAVNPYQRVPSGIPDIEENPPRHPDAIPEYKLFVMPSGQINPDELGPYHLVIGRIRRIGGRYEVDDNFIPPCTSMSGHPDLLRYVERFSGYMNSIEKASKDIIYKVQNSQKTSTIAVNAFNMCREIMRNIAGFYFIFRNSGRFMQPIQIVNCFSTLAHTCFISLVFMNKMEKEELLKYFYEWSNVSPGSFEDILSETIGIVYEHNNIRQMMLYIERFLDIFSELWINLSKLEYIGQHKDNVVVAVRSGQQEIDRDNWSIID